MGDQRSSLDRTSIILDQVREEAGWTWKQVNKLLLAGGSTRMPQVTTLIRTATGHSANTELHPDEVVAAGAALQAAILLPRNESVPIMTDKGKSVPSLIVQDVTAHSLGVLALLDHGQLFNSIILHKNSPLPASGTDIFGTVVHNQQIYECQVTEGESMDPADVQEIGTGTIRLPGTYPAESPMQVSMSYDRDGIVHVYVHDLVANRPLGELRIERQSNLDPREVLELTERSSHLELE
jgi:molecular chaperone DnaK